jgi:hypothetical protein
VLPVSGFSPNLQVIKPVSYSYENNSKVLNILIIRDNLAQWKKLTTLAFGQLIVTIVQVSQLTLMVTWELRMPASAQFLRCVRNMLQ